MLSLYKHQKYRGACLCHPYVCDVNQTSSVYDVVDENAIVPVCLYDAAKNTSSVLFWLSYRNFNISLCHVMGRSLAAGQRRCTTKITLFKMKIIIIKMNLLSPVSYVYISYLEEFQSTVPL